MNQDKYGLRGVSSQKEEVHKAIQHLDKGLFPKAFCKILPDFMGDFGYESKQRGRLVWNACKANRQGVAAAMGAEAFQAFLSLEIEL